MTRAERRTHRGRQLGRRRPTSGASADAIRQAFERVPPAARFGAFLFVAALVPLLSSNEYVIRVGVDTLIFALLALGLNVVVGFAGLLDLGYIAFYGFGAYMYALLASDKFGIHWPAEAALPRHPARRRGARPAPRTAVAPAARRLPGDRDAVLRARRSSRS